MGFNLSDSDQELRRDILLLLETLRIHTEKTESRVNQPDIDKYELVNLPVQAYLAVIYDYYSRGYYKERETIYSNAKRGKIDWNRTIKKNIKYLQDDEVLFLDFTTRRNQIKDNELITMIHEYCVYESSFRIVCSEQTRRMHIQFRYPHIQKLFNCQCTKIDIIKYPSI